MGARILVADDSVTIQKVVELTFSKEDFSLVQARSGEEAIRKAKEMRPDIILLDLIMPDKNGYDVCTALRADPNLKEVPIILLAGTFESYDQERGKRAGANDVVTKPFESQALIGKVKQALFARSLDAAAPVGAPPPTLSLDEDTLRIPSAALQGRMGEPAASKAQTNPALSQDDLWQLLESPGAPSAPGGTPAPPPAELSLEELAPAPPSLAAEIPALDLGTLESVPSAPPPAPSEAALAESLSLDDLLSAPAPPPAQSEETAPLLEGSATPSTIELSGDEGLPPLPMVEASQEAAPAFSIDDLLAEPEALAASTPEAASLDLSELDLGAAAPLTEPIAPVSGETLPEISLEEIGTPESETAEPTAPADVISAPELTGLLGVPGVIEPPTEVEEPVPPPVAVEEVAEIGGEAGADLAPSAVAEITHAVTQRVAADLAQELRNTLIERVEKIVWEVVPDLAEILITKEIERIRRLAEEDKSA